MDGNSKHPKRLRHRADRAEGAEKIPELVRKDNDVVVFMII
jgi:hypothetical protein